MQQLLISPAFFGAVAFISFFLIYIYCNWYFKKAAFKKRIKNITNLEQPRIQADGTKVVPIKAADTPNIVVRLTEAFKGKNKKTVADFKKRFERCGWDPYSAAVIVPIVKVISMIFATIVYFILNKYVPEFAILSPMIKFPVLILMLFIGFRSFDYITDIKISQRGTIISRDLPMVIDLLVVCVRAGLSLDAALDRIAQEIIYTNPDLARELTITAAELSILPERRIAYDNLASRIDSDLIKNLTTSLVQAENQGVAIGKTLMIISQEFSKHKLLEIETQAAKLPAKLTIPVILFSLPCIMIIILGPTIVKIMETSLFK